jgi:flagella basal body P-ring formation protein FlgA
MARRSARPSIGRTFTLHWERPGRSTSRGGLDGELARSIAVPVQRQVRSRSRSREAAGAAFDRDLRIAIFVATLAFLAVLASRVHAEPLDAVVRARLASALPAGLEVARVYLPAGLSSIDTTSEAVAIELPRELRAGRPSIKLTVRGHRSAQVPVAISAACDIAIAQRPLSPGEVIGAGDLAIEHRAIADLTPAPVATLVGATVTAAIAAGAPIGAHDIALPPPLPRGTQIAIDIRRGAVHVRGTGTLELAARPGEPASARLAATRLVVHGTLVAPATLVVGGLP